MGIILWDRDEEWKTYFISTPLPSLSAMNRSLNLAVAGFVCWSFIWTFLFVISRFYNLGASKQRQQKDHLLLPTTSLAHVMCVSFHGGWSTVSATRISVLVLGCWVIFFSFFISMFFSLVTGLLERGKDSVGSGFDSGGLWGFKYWYWISCQGKRQ